MNRTPVWLTTALGIAVLAGILLGWSPLYWPVAVSISSIAAVAILWAIFGARVNFIPELMLVALISCWGFLQLAFGHSVVPAMTLRSSLTWLGCGICFVLGSNILSDRHARNLFLRMTMWALAVLAIEALLQLFLDPQKVFGLYEGPESVTGTLFYRNQFAALMEIGGAAALWQALKGRFVIGGICFAAMFGAVVATASRAGAALMVTEVLIFAGLALAGKMQSESRFRSMGLVVITFALAAAAVVGTDTLWGRFQDRDLFAMRTELRNSTQRMIPDAPLAGTGMGTWRAVYPRYATLDAAVIANEAHNDWLQWMADGGVLFFLLMAMLVLRVGATATGQVWGIGLIAVMVHCLVDYPMRSPAISFLWFTLAGAACVLRVDRETLPKGTIPT